MDLTGMTTVSFSSRALQAERGNRAIICSFLMLHAGSATQVLRCCQLCPKNNCALHTEPGTLKVCCLNKHRGQMKPCLLRLVAPMGSFYTLCHTATPGPYVPLAEYLLWSPEVTDQLQLPSTDGHYLHYEQVPRSWSTRTQTRIHTGSCCVQGEDTSFLNIIETRTYLSVFKQYFKYCDCAVSY